MTAFSAALGALNLGYPDAAELLPHDGRAIKVSMVQDWARGKSRVPVAVWRQLADLFAAVEAAADDIMADQGERDGGQGIAPHEFMIETIPLPHPALREAAAARAMLVLGAHLLRPVGEREKLAL